jgi:hypothetical protein
MNSKAEILHRAGCHVANAAGRSASVFELNSHLTVTFTRDWKRHSKALAASVERRRSFAISSSCVGRGPVAVIGAAVDVGR